mgnify:CR=1 FL=1
MVDQRGTGRSQAVDCPQLQELDGAYALVSRSYAFFNSAELEAFSLEIAEELLWVNRVSRIYFDGKYVDYPLKISNALKAIGPVVAGRAMADYGRTRVKQRISPSPVESMEDAYIDGLPDDVLRGFDCGLAVGAHAKHGLVVTLRHLNRVAVLVHRHLLGFRDYGNAR